MLAKLLYPLIVATLVVLVSPLPSTAAESPCPSVLDHKFANLQDEPVSLCQFSGKVLLIVNTASECGYTPQYDGLEKLYRRYRDKGFAVLGFPANDFGSQEPGSNKEIAQFCRLNYGVTFPMFAKTSVVGTNANALFQELSATTGKPPRWNFHKYLLDRTGKPVAVFESAVEPEDRKVAWGSLRRRSSESFLTLKQFQLPSANADGPHRDNTGCYGLNPTTRWARWDSGNSSPSHFSVTR